MTSYTSPGRPRGTVKHAEETVKISIALPAELADLVEKYRNYIPRNSWIIVAMVEKLQREGRLPQGEIMEE